VYATTLAAVCALIWGASDFCGGKATQRAHPLSVTVISQILGLPMIALMVVVIPGTPRGADLLWGAAAGVLGLFGIVLLYRGLSGGAMAVVAPTTAVTSAIVPILGGLVQGERPEGAALAGAFCAVAAIGLVSLAPSRPGEPAKVSAGTVGLALLAGACFGGFFIILGFADESAGLWPMLGVRASSLTVGILLAWRAGARLRLTGRRTLALAAAAGLGDTLANGFYLLAVQNGDLSVIAPIAALYPASTVLLAFIVEKERMRPLQFAGLGLAALALMLTAS